MPPHCWGGPFSLGSLFFNHAWRLQSGYLTIYVAYWWLNFNKNTSAGLGHLFFPSWKNKYTKQTKFFRVSKYVLESVIFFLRLSEQVKCFLAPEDNLICLVIVPIIIMTHSLLVMSTSTFESALTENNIIEVKSIVLASIQQLFIPIQRWHNYRDNPQSLSHTFWGQTLIHLFTHRCLSNGHWDGDEELSDVFTKHQV